MKSDKERFLDVLEAIERIEKYSGQGKTLFDDEELIQNWILHHLQIIGEALSKISHSTKKDNPEIPWKKIKGMRNILVHDYFGIDTKIVWNVVENELPSLKIEITTLINKL
ncbi:MAG: DUF86 domain-containing protein [Calditrichaeota bacterium]|nr:MAG: DUF86 domain-containing protein [Calditrichota bacterium]